MSTELREEMDDMANTIGELQCRLAAERDKVKRSQAQVDRMVDRLAAETAKREKAEAEAAELRAEVAGTNMLLAERTARRDELVAENERLRAILDRQAEAAQAEKEADHE